MTPITILTVKKKPEHTRKEAIIAAVTGLCMTVGMTASAEFAIRQIADETYINRTPVISETGLVAWKGFRLGPDATSGSDIFVYRDGERFNLTEGAIEPHAGNNDPQVHGDAIVWVSTITTRPREHTWVLRDPPLDPDMPEPDARFAVADGADNPPERQILRKVGGTNFIEEVEGETPTGRSRRSPSGDNEIMYWDGNEIMRITADGRNDLAPGFWGDTIAWQKARGWPYGWEIMVWADGHRMQMTTNYYYDMAPRVHDGQVVWYGWDGSDYQIFLYDHEAGTTTQITDNSHDDVSPRNWGGEVVWEGFPTMHSDIFLWRDGEIIQLSDNVEDDLNPQIWDGQVVWQSFDGDFFQIYHFDGNETVRLTNTRYDNVNPQIRDGVITWMGYVDNYDAEIFAWTGGPDPIRLTENDYEDQHPRTAGGRIVWQADFDGQSHIFLAEPR